MFSTLELLHVPQTAVSCTHSHSETLSFSSNVKGKIFFSIWCTRERKQAGDASTGAAFSGASPERGAAYRRTQSLFSKFIRGWISNYCRFPLSHLKWTGIAVKRMDVHRADVPLGLTWHSRIIKAICSVPFVRFQLQISFISHKNRPHCSITSVIPWEAQNYRDRRNQTKHETESHMCWN